MVAPSVSPQRVTPTSATPAPLARVKRSRDPLSPKPILDRRLLTEALASRSIELKPGRLDQLYQLLHRQHYPPLPQFVEEYSRRDKVRLNGGGEQQQQQQQEQEEATGVVVHRNNNNRHRLPLKNAVSAKPNKKNLHLLPKALLAFLADPDCGFVTLTSKVAESRLSGDGTTTKMAVQLQDGHVVESVVMRHVSPSGSRATLCVSSQVGCAMGCTFCATGTMGIRGNLTSGEILEQIVHAGHLLAAEAVAVAVAAENESKSDQVSAAADDPAAEEEEEEEEQGGGSAVKENVISRGRRGKRKKGDFCLNHDLVRNVVFMGMGEPLNNYDNVVEACRGLIDTRRWNLKHGRVTVSTVGVTPKIRRLTRELPEVSLALSLHAPNQAMRSAIVPAAKAYPIEGLVDALDDHMMAMTVKGGGPKPDLNLAAGADADAHCVHGYSEKERKIASKRKRAMIEYVMLEGDTSSFECAHQLGKLCENRHLIVNLIPYNQTDVKDKLRCPPSEHVNEFQRIVMSYGAFCYVRRTMGADIAGACGQLVVEREQQEESAAAAGDIEDGPFQKTNNKPGGGGASVATIDGTKRRSKAASSSRQTDAASSKGEADNDTAATGARTDENGLDEWVRPLAIATAVAASCFVLSGVLLVTQRRRR